MEKEIYNDDLYGKPQSGFLSFVGVHLARHLTSAGSGRSYTKVGMPIISQRY